MDDQGLLWRTTSKGAARTSYVDPRVIDLFNDGVTVRAGKSRVAPGATISRTLEHQVLRMLKRA